MSRVAVTGAAGFIGRAIAIRLVADGHDVLSVGRRHPAIQNVRHIAWDLADGAPGPAELRSVDAVVHAAAHVAPWGPPGPFRAVTVKGTARLLDGAGPAARLVVIGSASVYDPRVDHHLVKEAAAPVGPARYLNEYGRAKAAQEHLVLDRRPDAIVLRPRAVWGPGDPNLLPRMLGRVRGDRLLLPAGGRRPLSATHVGSVATAVVAALERPAIRGPVNVADASVTSAAALAAALFHAMGRRVRIVAVPGWAAHLAARGTEAVWHLTRSAAEPPVTAYAVAILARAFTLDLTRLHEELGVRPDVDVPSAAREVAAALADRGP